MPESIYHHLIKLLNDYGVLLFIINNTFVYSGVDRGRALKAQKYYFLPRFTFAPVGNPQLDPGVLVYHAGNVPEEAVSLPVFIDLPRANEILSMCDEDYEMSLYNRHGVSSVSIDNKDDLFCVK